MFDMMAGDVEEAQRVFITHAEASNHLGLLAEEIDPVAESAIMRCLDPDPSARPESALAVAVSLPGGEEHRVGLFQYLQMSVESLLHAGEFDALHDADGDGKLKYRMFPPKILEGFGFSNNYVPTTKPRFSKARFRLADVSAGMTIRLVYPD